MMPSLSDLLFGCVHSNVSFPQGKGMECHICCLDCGREFSYDWQRMEVRNTSRKGAIAEAERAVDAVMERI